MEIPKVIVRRARKGDYFTIQSLSIDGFEVPMVREVTIHQLTSEPSVVKVNLFGNVYFEDEDE